MAGACCVLWVQMVAYQHAVHHLVWLGGEASEGRVSDRLLLVLTLHRVGLSVATIAGLAVLRGEAALVTFEKVEGLELGGRG